MFGLNIVSSLVDGVSNYVQSGQELKKLKAESAKKVLEMETKAKMATQQAKIDMLSSSQDNNFKLDLIAMQNMNKSWKDEVILVIFIAPMVGSFIPQVQEYIANGFSMLNTLPDWYMYLLVGIIVSIMGLRGMLNDFMNKFSKTKFGGTK